MPYDHVHYDVGTVHPGCAAPRGTFRVILIPKEKGKVTDRLFDRGEDAVHCAMHTRGYTTVVFDDAGEVVASRGLPDPS